MRRIDLNPKECTTFWKTCAVCSDHFEHCMYNNPFDIDNSRLLPTAIPTLIDAPNAPKLKTSTRNPPTRKLQTKKSRLISVEGIYNIL